MSILLVSNFLSVNGLNRGYSEDLADRLEARGRRIVRTSSEVGRGRRLLDMVSTAWRRRRDYKVALIDVFSGPAFVWAETVTFELRRLGKPYVLTLHGGSLPAFAQRWPRRVRRLLQSAAAVVAPSEYLVESLRTYRADLSVVPNGLDVASYTFAPRERPGPRLVWVRAFHTIYNPVLAIEVLARIPTARLTMVGPDKDGSRIAVEQRARELGVTDRLTLVGQVPQREIPMLLAGADVFLNTTNVDNTPLSVLEAMASGLCVISTKVGGIPFMLRDGDTALLLPPNDAAAMTSAVERVVADAELAARLSRSGRAFAESRDWSHVLARWDQLIEDHG